ncbi:MAG: hypothetical protein CMJ58_20580 [Planctomycetaceae bacterium]|nr:hypothetical protein [Planctomycetaceae bacterium]
MSDSIRQYVGTNKKISVERSLPSNPRLNGFLVDASESLGVMHCFHDFMPDGFSVFRIADVTEVRSGKYERHWERMLKGEGLLSALAKPPSLDLTTMRSAIDSIESQYDGIIIECEDAEIESEDFYIGSVLSTNEEKVTIQHFDGLGNWDGEPSTLIMSDISLVQFDTPYINTFWKYLAEPSPLKGKT